jgi:hypothetical protein
MPPALTHDQCRQEMCAACGGRAGPRPVSTELGSKLRKWAQPGWSSEVMSYPTGICEYCRRLLSRCEKEGTTDLPGRPGATQRWQDFHLENISVSRGQLAAGCSCPICQARKSTSKSRGSSGSLNNVEIVKKVQIVTEEEEPVQEPESNTMCKECFQPRTGAGIQHSCTPAARKRNLAELVAQEEGSEEIVAKVLKDALGEGSSSVRLKQMNGGNSLGLKVTLGKTKKESGIVDAEVAAKLKKGLDLSGKDMKKALHILRKGNLKVEKNVVEVLEEVGRTLEDAYEDIKMEFEVHVEDEEEDQNKGKKKKKKKELEKKEVDVTIVKNSLQLVEQIMEARGLSRDTVRCRVVIDGGQGSLKIVASIFDSSVDPKSQDPSEKMTGVNRLLLLAEVDGGLERHHNVRLLLEKLNLHLLPGLDLVGDLCITNTYTGISKHGGKYACYVCEGPSTLQSGELRTFGSLHTHYQAYREAGSVPKKMSKYKNVINECLLEADPRELVGNVLPLPELHLLMGVGNHHHQLLLKVWPALVLFGRGKWTVHGRHGGALDGANTVRFLKKIEAMRQVAPARASPILDTLLLFRKIQHGCFGWELCGDYKQKINMFTESVAKLKVYCETTLKVKYTIPWKLHMVCCHLEPLLDRLGRGLAIVCEQAGEAVHAKFKRTKSRYNKNKYHQSHGKAQKKAVVHWNSWNIHPVNRKTMQKFRDKARARRAGPGQQ